MNKNARIVVVSSLAALVVLAGLWVFRDLFRGASAEIQCDDGARRTIDLREFSTQYWAYAVDFEASIQDVTKVSGKLEPRQLQELNAAQQQANEYRKYVVAGFNSCAISKAQYLEQVTRFQALDSVARQIDGLLDRSALDPAGRKSLAELVERYTAMAQGLAGEGAK
jgi:hypothetical protein